MALNTLGVTYRIPKELDVWNMVLNPDIVMEDYNHALNRIVKEKLIGIITRVWLLCLSNVEN
jgi:hypothetical protein